MARDYSLIPARVPRVETPFRRIVTQFPVPESIPIIETLYRYEPVAMRGQPPVVWDHAEGFQVYDRWGNQWIDWSSGVLITNAGHGRAEMVRAIVEQAESKLLTNYCFPSEIRARLVEKLASMLPEPLKKVFLLTTGSETVECAIKLCRTLWDEGRRAIQESHHFVRQSVSRPNAWFAAGRRNSVAQGVDRQSRPGLRAGSLSRWFPHDGQLLRGVQARTQRTWRRAHPMWRASFWKRIRAAARLSRRTHYMRELREWCTGHKALLVCDEVQAGLRPHRHAVGLRALRHRARPGLFRQRHLQFAAPRGRGRTART